ncbi:MAG TPA: beta-N-acetylglucosaminidase domain-containing protein, partial [Acidimicrobiia bacterium]|nr:beta-N-acetylglucosaminidase domain-containing protein [Acidimicrobiia bacterium]
MTRSFAARGIVEGFYGTPWTHDNRRHAISFLAPRGLNAYVYAPKDDTKHRAAWRERYDDDEQAQFRDLCAHAGAHDVQFGFAISPGLDITYDSSSDRALLRDKLVSMLDLGVTWFLLLVDDIPMRAGLAPAQAELAVWLLDAMRTAERAVTLTVCPT